MPHASVNNGTFRKIETLCQDRAMLRTHRDHRARFLQDLCCQSSPTMAADVESSGEKIVFDIRAHHMRKIISAS